MKLLGATAAVPVHRHGCSNHRMVGYAGSAAFEVLPMHRHETWQQTSGEACACKTHSIVTTVLLVILSVTRLAHEAPHDLAIANLNHLLYLEANNTKNNSCTQAARAP